MKALFPEGFLICINFVNLDMQNKPNKKRYLTIKDSRLRDKHKLCSEGIQKFPEIDPEFKHSHFYPCVLIKLS